MEMENKYASKGVAGAGLGLGIAGTALGALNSGLLNGTGLFNTGWNNPNCGYRGGGSDAVALGLMAGLMNNHPNCSEGVYVNRYEAGQSARIAELETEVKLRDSNIYTDQKILELYKYVDNKFDRVEHELADQRVYNATNTATINCLAGQIAQLQALTKLVIPNTSVCPGWGNVTITPAAAPATGA